jgi:hypothetical protein
MIQEFVDKYMASQDVLRAAFAAKHPDSYSDIVKEVVGVINPEKNYGKPDPEKQHLIDDGHYQGTLVFVIPEAGYQPSDYWYVKVGYGSCSGCDTLEAIRGYSDDKPTAEQVKDYMTLALHVVQGIKRMGDDIA